jgi:uncharacterized protein (DUF924 family)
MNARTAPWNDVLDFWFPEGRSSQIKAETHRDHWSWRLHGGADDMIVERFADLTRSAASGDLDDWASDPEGRLALIIVLDQFSRSLWRNTPRAFAQDPAALSLAMEGFSNGHYASLACPGSESSTVSPLAIAKARITSRASICSSGFAKR